MVKSILEPMNKNFTFDDLILLAYNETGDEKPNEIIKAFANNEDFLDEYQSIIEIKQKLDTIQEEPSESIINNILNYSKALNVFKLKPAVNTGIFIVN